MRLWSGRFVPEEARYQELMRRHHYLGALPKISETLWYVASWGEAWVALLSFSASASNRRIENDGYRRATSSQQAIQPETLLLAKGGHWIYPTRAAGREKTRDQRSNDQHANHQGESQGLDGTNSLYQVLQ